MALPFGPYEGQDLTSYQEGNKFLPRQFYSLNYTPSQKLASTIGNSGITNTEAAYPYKWPPEGSGGDGGGFSNTNKYGLNLDTLKTISSGKYVEKGGPGNMYGGNYVKTDRDIAQDEHGNWKDVNTNKNVYHANIPYKGVIGTAVDFVTGKNKYGNIDPYEGTWTGAEWDDEFDPTISGKQLNTYQRWKAKREFVAAQEKAAADKAAADQAAAHTRAQGRYDASVASGREAGHWYGGADYKGGASGDVTQAGPGRDPDDRMAQGGRIGYREGEFVDADVNIEGPGYDVNEQTAGFIDPQDALNDMSMNVFGKPLHDLTPDEYQMLIDMANDQAMGEQDQGIASLV